MRRGERRPFRPIPADFVERWPELGWDGAKAEWRVHARSIERWLDESGRDRMVLRRKRYLDSLRYDRACHRREAVRRANRRGVVRGS